MRCSRPRGQPAGRPSGKVDASPTGCPERTGTGEPITGYGAGPNGRGDGGNGPWTPLTGWGRATRSASSTWSAAAVPVPRRTSSAPSVSSPRSGTASIRDEPVMCSRGRSREPDAGVPSRNALDLREAHHVGAAVHVLAHLPAERLEVVGTTVGLHRRLVGVALHEDVGPRRFVPVERVELAAGLVRVDL